MKPEDRTFKRPWEETGPEEPVEEEIVADDIPAEEDAAEATKEPDLGPGEESSFDRFTNDDYLAATTSEYRGLAEQIARADTETFERQAVAAAMPGVGSGLIGFEDVTGEKGVSEEEIEHEEQARASDLTMRAGTAVVLLGLFIGSLFLGGVWFASFVAIIMVVSLGEFYATLRTRGYAPVALFGFVGVIGAAIGAYRSGSMAIAGFVAITVTLVAFFYSLVPRRDPLENAALTILGMAWVSMLAFAVIIGRSERAVPMIVLAVLLTAIFDIGGYFFGRTFGRRQIAPVVSPKKTLEGLIGGVVATFGLATVTATVPLFDPLTINGALLLATVVCVLAPLGDAAESVVKRALDTKDMGTILPGHGGMLDRIDALLFVVPVAYFLYERLGYL